MPRVNRTVVLYLLLISSSVFLLFQLYYYRKYVSKGTGASGVAGVPVGRCTGVQVFLPGLGSSVRMPLFLIDTAVLSLLSQDALRQRDRLVPEPHCGFLCTDRPITAFALQVALPLAAEQKGDDIPLHFLFRLHGYVIQVVFLYERSGNYLWHGALRLHADMDRSFAAFKQLEYGRHAGAYDRPELVLTVLDGLDVRIPRNVTRFLSEQRHAVSWSAVTVTPLYPDDSSPDAVDFRRKVKQLLHLAARTLARINVPFWLSSGTCLGWFRQCSVISYSRDVDIGIFIADYRPDIISAFTDAGLKLKHKFGKVEDSLELSFLSFDVKLDIFFFYDDGDVMWNGGTQAKSGRKFKYVFPPFSLCWAELLELKVRVPCETVDYVTANYGASWSVPVRTWDWKTSPSNVMENGVWPPGEWAELIQVY
uniref:Fukutin n=1 Tax=Sphaeramia orbicularis TaxID=375764 RepID=A0A673B069_9TELE